MTNLTAYPAAGEAMATPEQIARPSKHIPWYLWSGAIALSCCVSGIEWDICWHQSIGRDTFWTPAHMMIYLCGVLTGLTCGYLVLATTFGRSAVLRANAVSVFGFRSPLGAFLATWGGLAMLVSAPFDNWWHAAYGLDVQLLSPPHCLLFIGIELIGIGFLVLIAGAMNRADSVSASNHRRLRGLFLYAGCLMVYFQLLIVTQRLDLPSLHLSGAYRMLAILLVLWLTFLSEASRWRWTMTTIALFYSCARIAAILIFPLFPATPKLGPVLTPITHMVPLQFPLLLVVPALALDLLWPRLQSWPLLVRASFTGSCFVALLVAAEWPFATFLVTSPAARNRFFGTIYTGFLTLPADRLPRFSFFQSGWPLAEGLLLACLYASVTSLIGMRFGRWLRTVQR